MTTKTNNEDGKKVEPKKSTKVKAATKTPQTSYRQVQKTCPNLGNCKITKKKRSSLG